MTYQPYVWPRPDGREVKDSVREHKKDKRARRAADPTVNPLLVLVIVAATIVAMIMLNVHIYKHDSAQYDWAANASTVQQELNTKYVEDIQVIREQVSTGRGHRWMQTFGIDGVVRTDCEVPNDTNPTIVCDSPVTLTPETFRTQGDAR